MKGGPAVEFYPINLNLNGKKVLIVGGGKVALRKFKRLLLTKAQIIIVSPEFNPGFKTYITHDLEQCRFIKRKFEEKDLIGQFLIFAATDNSKLNQRIALLARGKNILVNIIDNADLSDFTVPAALSRGALLLTASTGSNLPALSKKIKEQLEQEFGLEYQILLELMKEKRDQIIAEIDEISVRRKIFKKLASDQFLNKIKIIMDQLNFNLKEKQADEAFNNRNFNLKNKNIKQLFREVETEMDRIITELKGD
jgi:precorrin-2 dehydrogenase/sirohydrochlorin ferrochelatase